MSINTFSKHIAAAAAIALLSSGAAFAQEATPDTWLQTAVSSKTRAEVQAELVSARASGLTKAWSAGYIEPQRSQLARANVKAATLRAIHSGEVDAINAEVYSFVPAAAMQVAQASR